jgi:hypothetical protein
MGFKAAKHSVVIQALANRMKEACVGIDFIGNDGKPYNRDYERDALWYTAYHIAEGMTDGMRTKDWAHFVLDGMEALSCQDVVDHFYPEGDEAQHLPTEEECVKWLHG